MRSLFVSLLVLSFSWMTHAQGLDDVDQSIDQTADQAVDKTTDQTGDREPAARSDKRTKKRAVKPQPTEASPDQVEGKVQKQAEPILLMSYPLNSMFFLPPRSGLVIEPGIKYGIQAYTNEVTNRPSMGQTAYYDRQKQSVKFSLDGSYGVTDEFSFGIGFGYAQVTTSNTGYHDTSTPYAANPAGPDVKDSGLVDPHINADYRLMGRQDGDWTLDIGANLTAGVQSAKRGVDYSSTFSPVVNDTASSGNVAEGGSSVTAKGSFGKMFTSQFGARLVGLADFGFSRKVTVLKYHDTTNTIPRDIDFNYDGSTSFTGILEGEWRITPMVTLNPFVGYTSVPKQKATYEINFSRYELEVASGSMMRLGLGGGFMLMQNLALLGQYEFQNLTVGNQTWKQNNFVQQDVTKTNSNTVHNISASLRYWF